MPTQNMANFLAIFDKIFPAYAKSYKNDLIKQSKAMDFLMKPIDVDKDGKPIMGLPTFTGRRVQIDINADYATTTANLSDFAIAHGDETAPTTSRNLIQAEIAAVDKGFSVGITTADLQNLDAKSGSLPKNYANWIESHWRMRLKGMAIHTEYDIWNGTGTITTSTGATKDGFYGFPTIVGSGTYGGKTTSDWNEWQGHTFDMANDLFGMTASSQFDTIAHLTQVGTGEITTPFYKLLWNLRDRMLTYNPGMSASDIGIFLHPYAYNQLLIPSLEANRKAAGFIEKSSLDKEIQIYGMADYVMDGSPIYKVDTMLPATSIGGTPTYLFPTGYVHFINKKELHLEANDRLNFEIGNWEKIPGQHEVWQRQVNATLLFYASKRWSHATLKLPTAINTLIASAYGNI
ncbi:MAG: hypothetical protein ACYDEI_00085 [Erysipelotrichaceae bacterium]